MATFPSLSADPTIRTPPVPVNPAIITDFEAGYVQSRPRFTRSIRRWEVTYDAMTGTDYALLETFYRETVLGSSERFDWTDTHSVVQTVRFTPGTLLDVTVVVSGPAAGTTWYAVIFELEEA